MKFLQSVFNPILVKDILSEQKSILGRLLYRLFRSKNLNILVGMNRSQQRHRLYCAFVYMLYRNNMPAIFLKPLILRTPRTRKIKGFRKMAKGL